MNLTKAEKLILAMLSDIHEHLNIKGEIDPKLVKTALWNDKAWGLAWEYSMLFQGPSETPENVSEVVSILEMWSMIETYYERLSPQDKEMVKLEADPYGREVQFSGFDANDESESEYMGIAQFLVDDLHRWSNFKGRDFNSHAPMLDGYRRMLAAYEPLRPQITVTPFTAAQIASILKRQHSD